MEILKVEKRDWRKKGKAKKARKIGILPGIMYGPDHDPIPVFCKESTILKLLSKGGYEAKIFDIELLENGKTHKYQGIVKDIQIHPVTDKPLHFDVYLVSPDKTLTLDVPVVVSGKAIGVKKGGILEIVKREISVECLPKDIPSMIEIDVTELDIGDVIHIEDITPPPGVRILDDPKEPVCTIIGQEVSEEEEKEEGEEKTEES